MRFMSQPSSSSSLSPVHLRDVQDKVGKLQPVPTLAQRQLSLLPLLMVVIVVVVIVIVVFVAAVSVQDSGRLGSGPSWPLWFKTVAAFVQDRDHHVEAAAHGSAWQR